MQTRTLGRTGRQIPEISFGCGSQGGLLVRGDWEDQLRVVQRALDLGVTYFDTAAAYGDGSSEQALGRVLRELRADAMVGTKLRIGQADVAGGKPRIRELLGASLNRLGRDRVDILFLHSRIAGAREAEGKPDVTTPDQVLGPIVDAYRDFQREGRARWLGFTGLGKTAAIHQVVDAGVFDVMQCYFNAVNPSAAYEVPTGFDQQDLGRVMQRAAAVGMGILAIRILAAGALGEAAQRHPVAGPAGRPLMGGSEFPSDQRRAEAIRPFAVELGIGLDELAVRFALSRPEVSTALVGISSPGQLEQAVRAAEAGPLAADVCDRIVAAARQAGTATAA